MPAAPLPPLRDLTMPEASSKTVRALLSAAMGEALVAAASLGAGPARPGDALSSFRAQVWPRLRAERGLLASSLLQPSRLVLARLLGLGVGAPAERSAWARELALALTLDAAECERLPEPGASAPIGRATRLVSERRRVCYHLPEGSTARLSPSGLELSFEGKRASAGFSASAEQASEALSAAGGRASVSSVPLWAEASLVLEDTNPLAGVELHPNKSGSYVDLGDHPVAEWVARLGEAFAIIDRHLPEVAGEMRLLLRHVVPVGYFPEKHLSASYLEAMGVVYVSLHPHTMTLVEALVHEFQHNKLNLLLGLDRVLENAEWPLFASPVRPDPRPLRGVLLAVHAFQPVARLYERLCEQPDRPDLAWLKKRLGEIARLCHEGCGVVLPNGVATPAGRELLDEIAGLDEALLRHVPMAQLGAGGELP